MRTVGLTLAIIGSAGLVVFALYAPALAITNSSDFDWAIVGFVILFAIAIAVAVAEHLQQDNDVQDQLAELRRIRDAQERAHPAPSPPFAPCTRCGAAVPIGMAFCARCGAQVGPQP